jgi:hypothetical protein
MIFRCAFWSRAANVLILLEKIQVRLMVQSAFWSEKYGTTLFSKELLFLGEKYPQQLSTN